MSVACTGPPTAPAAAPAAQGMPPTAAAPTSAPGQLTLSFTATFPAAAQSAALNLSSALQTNPATVLLPVTVKHGPLTLSGEAPWQNSYCVVMLLMSNMPEAFPAKEKCWRMKAGT